MRRTKKRVRSAPERAARLAPLAIIVAAFSSYFVAEIALVSRPHPLHWVAALGGGGAGYAVTVLWAALLGWREGPR